MVKFIIRLLISALVIFAVAYFSNGVLLKVSAPVWALALALVLGIVNAVIKPIVNLLALPVTIVTLGLFSLVINAAMLGLAAWITPGVQTNGFWWTIVAALVISLVTSVLSGFVDKIGAQD